MNCLVFCLTVQNYYTKLLKLVSVKKKIQKKCTFLIESAFFSKIYRFLIVYPSLSASIFFLQYI